MSFLQQGAKTQSQQQPAYTGLDVQTSCYGKVLALAYGTTRVAPNLIWYGDFIATAKPSGAQGKGGSSVAGSTSYRYKTSVAMALCEGPIQDVGKVYVDKYIYPDLSAGTSPGFTLFNGDFAQSPWGYLVSAHPDQALNYPGVAYAAAPDYNLESSPSLGSFAFETFAFFSDSVPGQVDADPSLIVADIISDPHHGTSFPSACIGDLSTYQDYCFAAGLFLSFVLTDQSQASDVLTDIATATNSEFVWSNKVLTLVPYGDEAITGNGKTYTPPAAPEYDLTYDDFIVENQGDDPVLLARKRPSDAINSIQLEFSNRDLDYNSDIAEAKDQAAIDLYGLRPSSGTSSDLFASSAAANMSVQLQLQRQAVRNVYTFTLDQRFILLDPMDIVTIPWRSKRPWVRIIDITENDDLSLTFTAEEYLNGTGAAPLYSFETGQGYSPNYNAAPGDANIPVIFDAPVELATTSGLEVWMIASGGTNWGGAQIWISTDGDNYKLAGNAEPGRQGVLSASLSTGPDPDTTHTLSVNLSESRGELLSGTKDDADQANTLCYCDGELISYETATLTGTNAYDLTYLRRGLYGTTIAGHASGSQFARLDSGVFVYPYTKDQIGQAIYVKALSFNIHGAGQQTLADVDPYTFTIAGPPPPSNVTNFLVAQNGNAVNFTWTQIDDFALKGYDIGYAPEGTTIWTEFTLLTEASKGTEMTNASVPAGTWTFGIRARDIADQLSPAIASFDLVIENNDDTTTVQQQEPDWAGTLSGLVRHWTGVLIPESTSLANAYSDFSLFDTFVLDPVASAYYITPTYDIGFVNSLRVHSAYALTEGPGQSGAPAAVTALDSWTSGSDPGVYIDWTVGTIPVRYLNMKITYAPVAGQVAYLSDFTYTVDRSPSIEQAQAETISSGGSAITFPQPFHEIPYVKVTPISASALYATAANITTTGCDIHVWDSSGTDVGGTVSWEATGV